MKRMIYIFLASIVSMMIGNCELNAVKSKKMNETEKAEKRQKKEAREFNEMIKPLSDEQCKTILENTIKNRITNPTDRNEESIKVVFKNERMNRIFKENFEYFTDLLPEDNLNSEE